MNVILRPVTMQDAPVLLAWRNDPETRRWSWSEEEILPDPHSAWLNFALASGDFYLLIGEIEGVPVGLIRFHRLPRQVAEVSIVVAPAWRGQGIGEVMLSRGCRQALDAPWGITSIVARIKSKNLRSQGTFARAGFRETGVEMTFP